MPNLEGYPTDKQIEETFNAYKKGGEKALEEELLKRASEAKRWVTRKVPPPTPESVAELRRKLIERHKKNQELDQKPQA